MKRRKERTMTLTMMLLVVEAFQPVVGPMSVYRVPSERCASGLISAHNGQCIPAADLAPAPCGSQTNPCFVVESAQPIECRTVNGGTAFVKSTVQADEPFSRADSENAAQELAMCRLALDEDKKTHVPIGAFCVFIGICFTFIMCYLFERIDIIAKAWRRSELEGTVVFGRALTYFIAAFGGTAIALGVFH